LHRFSSHRAKIGHAIVPNPVSARHAARVIAVEILPRLFQLDNLSRPAPDANPLLLLRYAVPEAQKTRCILQSDSALKVDDSGRL
jgi:hypothetical protein